MVVKVIGMHRDSGEPMTRVYEVETEREAVDKAYAENMVIEETKRLPDPKVVETELAERQARQEAKTRAYLAKQEQKRNRLQAVQHQRMQTVAQGRHVQWVRLTGMSELSLIVVIAIGVFLGSTLSGCIGGIFSFIANSPDFQKGLAGE